MPIVRSSFSPHGQNFEIPKIDFRDVITSVLYMFMYDSIPIMQPLRKQFCSFVKETIKLANMIGKSVKLAS